MLPALLLFATFGVYASTAARTQVNDDAYAASAGAWRIAATGAPYFEGVDLERVHGSFPHDHQWIGAAPNGHVTALRSVGPILAAVPFYLLLERDSDPDSFSVMPGGLAASFLTALAVLLIFLALRHGLPDGKALAASLVFAFATPTWSVSANGMWTHPLTQLGVAGAAYSASRKRLWLAGIFLGVGMLGRPHVALIAAFFGLGLSVLRRDARPAIRVAIPTLGALGLIELWNRVVLGTWSLAGAYGDGPIVNSARGAGSGGDWQLRNYVGFLVSADKGFLVWSPMVLVMLPAVVRAWKEVPDWSRALAAGGVVYSVVQIRMNIFTGGDAFHAYRHALELLTCITPLFALSIHRLGRFGRLALPVVLAVQFAAFSLGASVEGAWVQPREVWTHNGFIEAFRIQPAITGPWLVICLVVGLAISLHVIRAELSTGGRKSRIPENDDRLGGSAP